MPAFTGMTTNKGSIEKRALNESRRRGLTALDNVDAHLKGVKGWLLLLSISLTFLDPFSILLNLILITNVLRPQFDKHPELLRLLLLNGTCSIGLAVFSIYAGVSLWKALPGAVAVAKKYFLAIASYSVISTFMPRLVGISDQASRDFSGSNLVNALFTIVYATLWYLYLKKSKRVKATYVTAETSNQL
jgi:hypothetical protein